MPSSINVARFELTVDPAEPHRITSLNLRRLEEMPPPRTSEAVALAPLRAKLGFFHWFGDRFMIKTLCSQPQTRVIIFVGKL
jgi:hypothetical protein